MRIVFLGPPGAGKGTQARELAREWSVPQISTGDMLREAMAAGTALGREAKQYYDRGELVPDDVILRMIRERLGRPDAAKGYIFDGFPRNLAQAEALEKLLNDLGQGLDAVLYFDVGEAELVRRLTGRRVCRTCGETFHVVSNLPRRDGVCDHCAGELYQRPDDREDTVRNRLHVYAKQTAPLLEYYRGRGLVTTIKGEGAIDAIRAELRRATAEAGRR
ncbi:MAG: adenylate kinase [Candidatus Rokubacteria bacterium]|nr:adenylate kinase [Candidatus Rokubacteria bacterium]